MFCGGLIRLLVHHLAYHGIFNIFYLVLWCCYGSNILQYIFFLLGVANYGASIRVSSGTKRNAVYCLRTERLDTRCLEFGYSSVVFNGYFKACFDGLL
ncbi:hypothetical protein DsansV1_C01g0008961 [Dioscorea sansibarensis]